MPSISENDPSQDYSAVYVVFDSHPESIRLLRKAKRRAHKLGVEWHALYVETPKSLKKSSVEEKEQILYLVTLAQQMGASVEKLEGKKVNDTISGYFKSSDISNSEGRKLIVIGDIIGDRFTHGNSLEQILKRINQKKFEIISVPLSINSSRIDYLAGLFSFRSKEILFCIIAVVAATALVELIEFLIPSNLSFGIRNKTIIYILATAFAASRYGLVAGMITSVVSFLTMSMIYISSSVNSLMNSPDDAVNLGLFLFTSIVLATLGNKDYKIRKALTERSQRLQSLIRVNRASLSKPTRDEAIKILNAEISEIIHNDVGFFLPTIMNPDKLETVFQDIKLSETEEEALYICWNESKITGFGTSVFEGCNWRFEPLSTPGNDIGVMGVRFTSSSELDSATARLLTDIASQVSLIVEHLELNKALEENRLQTEREKLRSMMLSSVSHDLKTPLAAIIGSLGVYKSLGTNLLEEQRELLINTAIEEARRLDSFITNILDMTRIEGGQIKFKKDWIDPDFLLTQVVKGMGEYANKHEVVILDSDNDKIEVCIDTTMTKQALHNLLDNAIKYTAENTRVELSWSVNGKRFVFTVRDYGKGIPEDKLEVVFDKYARIKKQDSQIAGTGLGLSIAKAVAEAQGGRVEVYNHQQGGTVFNVYFPVWKSLKKLRTA